ncbi:MAG: response regulator [Magnetococcales bacterium]|nr:response regulator [Magnetococcales bacterium]NGZ07046.1 response regulator [Magnetococcales bacterium]
MTNLLLDHIILRILSWTPVQILAASLLFSELGSVVVVSAMSLWLHGTIRNDFIITGIVTALLVSVVVVFILLRMMHLLRGRTHELQQLNADLHQVRDALLLMNDRLASSMRRMPVAFIVWDTSFRAVEWNPAAERIFGYERQEALGHTPLELFVPPAAYEPVAAAMANLLQGEEAGYSAPGNNITKDGRIISCLWFNVPLFTPERKVHGVLSMALDVTTQEEMGRALQEAKEKAEAANQAKSDFLATMSHEIRTPMNVVLGMSELLLESELNPEQRRYVQTMHHSGRALLGVINDILDFSRIEAGRIPLVDLVYAPAQVVQESVRLMQMAAEEKGLIVEESIGSAVPGAMRGDEGRLRQILINLLGNAIKFTDRGRVEVRLDLAKSAPEWLQFTVADTGIGMTEEQLSAIFEPFVQADGGITRRFGGTGLGLAITRRLVRRMGGEIWVESGLGQGSRFMFTLPIRVADVTELTHPLAEPVLEREVSSLRILLAEDQEINRMVFAGFLNRTPHRLVMVHDGQEAVERVMRESFDLIFMDVRMPRLDGYAATRRIRAWEQESGHIPVPIIALSAHAAQDEQQRCQEAGCMAYLAKPIHRKVLLRHIDQMARQLATGGVLSGLRILLVEDTEENRILFAAYLQDSPHRVTMAHDGLEAVAKVAEEVFDVVIMDVRMPRMDGYTATTRIRQWEAERNRSPMTIIALTAHAMEGESERSRQAGCDFYRSKPISKKQLLTMLATIGQQRAVNMSEWLNY